MHLNLYCLHTFILSLLISCVRSKQERKCEKLAHVIAISRCNVFEPSVCITEGNVKCNNCLENATFKTKFQEKKPDELEKAERSIESVLLCVVVVDCMNAAH